MEQIEATYQHFLCAILVNCVVISLKPCNTGSGYNPTLWVLSAEVFVHGWAQLTVVSSHESLTIETSCYWARQTTFIVQHQPFSRQAVIYNLDALLPPPPLPNMCHTLKFNEPNQLEAGRLDSMWGPMLKLMWFAWPYLAVCRFVLFWILTIFMLPL